MALPLSIIGLVTLYVLAKRKVKIANAVAYTFFGILVLGVVMHFASYGEMPAQSAPSDRVAQLEAQLAEQKAIYHQYAPIAQQARIAERQLTLANQKASLIREELAMLRGKAQGQ